MEQKDKQSSAGFPFASSASWGTAKANQEVEGTRGETGIQSTEKEMEGFEGPWWHQNPYAGMGVAP